MESAWRWFHGTGYSFYDPPYCQKRLVATVTSAYMRSLRNCNQIAKGPIVSPMNAISSRQVGPWHLHILPDKGCGKCKIKWNQQGSKGYLWCKWLLHGSVGRCKIAENKILLARHNCLDLAENDAELHGISCKDMNGRISCVWCRRLGFDRFSESEYR